ncbi:hypothetical protein SAMN05421788_1054 [Filimonas lacunae]|uniref:DUF5007 domain-containing protein n=1 Tax=Filimonas lacunae TaxID=477680 RepID=A0A173MDF2_9BACT|nr:hypothetical protein [Filimonas lacunae]BAV05550.1 hypothetical protein FLA_1557 [Filimonas lacunae]SIT20441.1 hypothetical protein SAMN05421788_1054 [Filimonas lacunae]
MRKLTIKKVMGISVMLLAGIACQKKVRGYLSDDIFYTVNPFEVQQGVTAVSGSLVLNGSSAPLHVELAALRDADGNDADSILRTPRSIKTFKGTLDYTDSTLALFNAKLNDSLVRPFNIADIGGRLQFTAATTYVPAGTYNMDLVVSNINGEKYLKDACQITIKPVAEPYKINWRRVQIWDVTKTTVLQGWDNDANCPVDVQYVSGTEQAAIVYKFVDKNGKAFNPKNGEVKAWSTSLPTLHNWAPYYPLVLTDSTLVQQLPYSGLAFPYYTNVLLDNGQTLPDVSCRLDYQIFNTTETNVVKSMTSLTYGITSGTYYVTAHLNTITHR